MNRCSNGQPQRKGEREYVWDALGRLVEVRQENKNLARYTYNHRGERVLKTAGGQTTTYLYEEKKLNAELDAIGQIVRQYLYLADLPLAVIDTPWGKSLEKQEQTFLFSLREDLKTLLMLWTGSGEQPVWIHGNHLGAPEAATDASGNLIWQASYQPFGAASLQSKNGFTLHLRLPGQYEDTETGLYYNRQRYYDPVRGQYLSPDPAGNPDGPNGYAYVRHNPLKYIDPEGLILFAFDGTGNTNDEQDLAALGNGISNVWQFRQLYNDGNRRYVSGVGTRYHEADPQFGGDIYSSLGSTADMGGNFTGPDRITRMVAYFNAEAELFADNDRLMDVDIIGFSRGASEARDFANRISARTKNGAYIYTININGVEQQRCQMINFRFMGLWDTVLSTNLSGTTYSLDIIPEFQYVAQAVALNEYRGYTLRKLPQSTGAFPLESIMSGTVPAGQERVEMGFIGAHADIGGGFAGQISELPLATLNWMVEQARNAGVKVSNPLSTIGTSVVIHDKSDNQYCLNGPGCSEYRTVRYRDGATTTQRQMTGTNMTNAETGQFISYYPSDLNSNGDGTRTPYIDASTGMVNMKGYIGWLKAHGYELGDLKVQ